MVKAKNKSARCVRFAPDPVRPCPHTIDVRMNPLERLFITTLTKHVQMPDMVFYLRQLASKLYAQGALTPAKVRNTLQGVRSAANPPYNIGPINCTSVATLEAELDRRINASQIAHEAMRQLEQQAAALSLSKTLRTDNGLPICDDCSKQRGFPCYSRVRDTGRAAKSNGGKANNTKCHCTLCGHVRHA